MPEAEEKVAATGLERRVSAFVAICEGGIEQEHKPRFSHRISKMQGRKGAESLPLGRASNSGNIPMECLAITPDAGAGKPGSPRVSPSGSVGSHMSATGARSPP